MDAESTDELSITIIIKYFIFNINKKINFLKIGSEIKILSI